MGLRHVVHSRVLGGANHYIEECVTGTEQCPLHVLVHCVEVLNGRGRGGERVREGEGEGHNSPSSRRCWFCTSIGLQQHSCYHFRSTEHLS